MARILIISTCFYPDRGGGSAVNTDLCVGLGQLGHEVTVWCPYSHYPEWRDKSGKNGWQIESSSMDGIQIERFGLYIPMNPNRPILRILYEASFFLSMLRRFHHARHFDVVMAFCPMVSAVGFGAMIKRFFRIPLWLNVQDLAAQAAAASGLVKRHWWIRLLVGIQSWAFNQADVWSTISPVMQRKLSYFQKGNQPIHLLPNWCNQSLAEEIRKRPNKKGRTPANPIKLLYAGNIGQKQNLLHFVQTLQRSDMDFELRIHGAGVRAGAVETWLQEQQDPRFSFGPFLNESNFAQALHDTDIFIITEIEDSGDSFLPSKLMPVMESGTPLICICGADGPLGIELQESGAGELFPWDEIGSLPKVLDEVQVNPTLLEKWQTHALKRAQHYNREQIVSRFSELLPALSSPPILTSTNQPDD